MNYHHRKIRIVQRGDRCEVQALNWHFLHHVQACAAIDLALTAANDHEQPSNVIDLHKDRTD